MRRGRDGRGECGGDYTCRANCGDRKRGYDLLSVDGRRAGGNGASESDPVGIDANVVLRSGGRVRLAERVNEADIHGLGVPLRAL